jgi:hypothetical protein
MTHTPEIRTADGELMRGGVRLLLDGPIDLVDDPFRKGNLPVRAEQDNGVIRRKCENLLNVGDGTKNRQQFLKFLWFLKVWNEIDTANVTRRQSVFVNGGGAAALSICGSTHSAKFTAPTGPLNVGVAVGISTDTCETDATVRTIVAASCKPWPGCGVAK